MKFLFIYRGGKVPQDKMEENGKDWYAWIGALKEKAGFRTAGGKTVSEKAVHDYKSDVTGLSIIEADSLEEAVKRAKDCPGLAYGCTVDVLEEFKM